MWMGEKYILQAGDEPAGRYLTGGGRAVTLEAGAFLTAADTTKLRESSQIAIRHPGWRLRES